MRQPLMAALMILGLGSDLHAQGLFGRLFGSGGCPGGVCSVTTAPQYYSMPVNQAYSSPVQSYSAPQTFSMPATYGAGSCYSSSAPMAQSYAAPQTFSGGCYSSTMAAQGYMLVPATPMSTDGVVPDTRSLPSPQAPAKSGAEYSPSSRRRVIRTERRPYAVPEPLEEPAPVKQRVRFTGSIKTVDYSSVSSRSSVRLVKAE